MDDIVKESLGAGEIPSEISEAIVRVILSLGVLGKDQTNNFDRYEYASIDDFIKFVRKDAAESGLFFIVQEKREPELKELQSKKGTPLLMWWAPLSFWICHASGKTYGPINKTVMVQASGAQAAGSAQSYGLKQLMRGLFLIPTGEKDDPDKMETAEYSSKNQVQNNLQVEAGRIKKALESAKSAKLVRSAWGANGVTLGDIREKSDTAYTFLETVRDDCLKKFEAK